MSYEQETASIYDLYFPADRSDEADLWLRLASGKVVHILEPMVGTAEVALILARRGYHVTGVDLSPAMLEAARKKAAAESPETARRLAFIHSDLGSVTLPEAHFDLAFISDSSWNLITDEGDRLAALGRIRQSLRPGGVLAMELYPPLTLGGRSEPRQFKPLRPVPKGWEVFKTSWMERDAATQTVHIHEELSINGTVSHHRLTLQALHPEQLATELGSSGFGPYDFYGDYGLQPYSPGSYGLIARAVNPG